MNCVIDSRFVLKITDYGIPGLLERSKTDRDFEARGETCFFRVEMEVEGRGRVAKVHAT